ncbi:uncharacterized protein LOC125312659 [Rhodamnia argentea]|uniref:Uncharacterized protein LOC125312659 n=1 Tax=Rhodamnia argentea TaxID=178133 RepID=A0ABM3GSV0_9MYRT|nr:uncharacterized protein LOC125312659 [Rhodamnia argentea]
MCRHHVALNQCELGADSTNGFRVYKSTCMWDLRSSEQLRLGVGECTQIKRGQGDCHSSAFAPAPQSLAQFPHQTLENAVAIAIRTVLGTQVQVQVQLLCKLKVS